MEKPDPLFTDVSRPTVVSVCQGRSHNLSSQSCQHRCCTLPCRPSLRRTAVKLRYSSAVRHTAGKGLTCVCVSVCRTLSGALYPCFIQGISERDYVPTSVYSVVLYQHVQSAESLQADSWYLQNTHRVPWIKPLFVCGHVLCMQMFTHLKTPAVSRVYKPVGVHKRRFSAKRGSCRKLILVITENITLGSLDAVVFNVRAAFFLARGFNMPWHTFQATQVTSSQGGAADWGLKYVWNISCKLLNHST